MQILAGFRIRSRLLLLLVFSVLALLLLGAFSSWTITREAARATNFIDLEFASVQALSDVRAAIGNARRYEKDIFLTMGDEKETTHYEQLWRAEVDKVVADLKAKAQQVAGQAETRLRDGRGLSTGDIGELRAEARQSLGQIEATIDGALPPDPREEAPTTIPANGTTVFVTSFGVDGIVRGGSGKNVDVTHKGGSYVVEAEFAVEGFGRTAKKTM